MKTSDSDQKIIIYGANIIARQLYYSLCRKGMRAQLQGFAVSDMTDNPANIDGVPVKAFTDYLPEAQHAYIMLAMGSRLQRTVTEYVKSFGCQVAEAYGFREINTLERWEVWQIFNNSRQGVMIAEAPEDDTYQNILLVQPEDLGTGTEQLSHFHLKYMALTARSVEDLRVDFSGLNLKQEYADTLGEYESLSTCLTQAEPTKGTCKVYMCISHRDKAPDIQVESRPWVYPLQAGSALTEVKITGLRDDMGDNISSRNPVFGEMTAAYWLWKHDTESDYKGLCHYRRHYILSQEDIGKLLGSGLDAVLTTPRLAVHGIRNMFLADNPVMDQQVFADMLTAVEQVHPGEHELVGAYLEQKLYYPNNMVIARQTVYNDYCQWLFAILFQMEANDRLTGNDKQDRHIAYAAELLTSYYFAANKSRYRLAVTDYRFYD